MLRAAIIFFILGIVSMFLGINSIAGLSIEIGKILLVVFLVLSIISFFMGRSRKPSLLIALTFLATIAGASIMGNYAHADDTVTKTAKEVANDTHRATKQVVRVAKDQTCEMVNGKMKCAVQKAKHAIQKSADNVEDAID